MNYSTQKYGGITAIFLALEPKKLKTAKREIIKYLRQAGRLNYSKKDLVSDAQFYVTDYLESAKNRIKFNGERVLEKGLNIAMSMARYMLLNEDPDRGNYLEKIDQVNSSRIRQIAGKHISQRAYVIISIVPKEKK